MHNKSVIYNRWLVLAACIAVNLSVGIGYAWSVFVEPLSKVYNWTPQQLALVYSINLGISPVALFWGSALQRRYKEKRVIIAGGLISSAGIFISGFVSSLPVLCVSYGVVVGLGANIAISAVLANTVKLFPDKSGLTMGLALAGYSTGAFVIAQAAVFLNSRFSIMDTFKIIGVATLVLISASGFFIKNAPEEAARQELKEAGNISAVPAELVQEQNWPKMLFDTRYFFIVLLFITGVFTGILIISSAAPIGREMYGLPVSLAALVVGIIALSNGGGRIIGGGLNDRFGSVNVFAGIYIATGLMLLSLVLFRYTAVFIAAMVGVGVCYGSSIITTASMLNKYYGSRYFASNYGITFVWFTVVSFIAPRIVANIKTANNGDYTKSYFVATAVVAFGLCMTFAYRWLFKKKQTSFELYAEVCHDKKS